MKTHRTNEAAPADARRLPAREGKAVSSQRAPGVATVGDRAAALTLQRLQREVGNAPRTLQLRRHAEMMAASPAAPTLQRHQQAASNSASSAWHWTGPVVQRAFGDLWKSFKKIFKRRDPPQAAAVADIHGHVIDMPEDQPAAQHHIIEMPDDQPPAQHNIIEMPNQHINAQHPPAMHNQSALPAGVSAISSASESASSSSSSPPDLEPRPSVARGELASMTAESWKRDHDSGYKYLAKDKLSSLKIHRGKDGSLVRKPHIDADDQELQDGIYGYAHSPGGSLYAAQHDDNLLLAQPEYARVGTSDFRHSVFTGGRGDGAPSVERSQELSAVRSAGFFRYANGEMTRINRNSGHFKPNSQHLLGSAQNLYAQGFLNGQTRITGDEPMNQPAEGYSLDNLAGSLHRQQVGMSASSGPAERAPSQEEEKKSRSAPPAVGLISST